MQLPKTDLRATFNAAAPLYDEVRPGYPEALISDILDLSGIEKCDTILEVGCGTGKATRPFAERGYAMVCLDIGSDLIAVAKERLKPFPHVSYVETTFEEWTPDRQFNLIISATAFHWVNPKVSYLRAAAALAPHGSLAIFSNRHIKKEDGFFAEVQDLYARYYFRQPVKPHNPPQSLPGISAFQPAIQRVYPWTHTYSSTEYIKLLSTYSDHIALPDRNRRLLFEGVAHLIETQYEGRITKHYEAVLNLRTLRSEHKTPTPH